MRFFYDNIMAIQVALVCSAFAWLFGGTVSSALLPTVPWLLAILCEGFLCFPQRHAGETTYEARARVWRRVGRDPLTWLVIAFTVMLIVPFFNVALCPCCDYPAVNFDGYSDAPPVPFIPFCIDRAEHLNVVLWFVPALTAMLAVKHALLKRGKRMVLELMVWNGLALSVIGILQAVTGAEGPLWCSMEPNSWGARSYFFSTFGYPNMAGSYFMLLFGLAVGLWREKVETAWQDAISGASGTTRHTGHAAFWRKHLLLIPSAIFFFSALMTLSRSAILFVSVLAILFFVHTFTAFLKRMKKVKRVKVTAINLLVLVLIATLFFVFMSDKTRAQIAQAKGRDIADATKSEEVTPMQTTDAETASLIAATALDSVSAISDGVDSVAREVRTVDFVEILDRMSGQGQYHAAIAMRIWKDHPFFGCGGWGYKHLCIPKMTEQEYDNLQRDGGINVHNDYLQFLAEHGAVGLILFLTIIVTIVWPIGRIWKALINAVRFTKPKDQPAKPIAIFALPAPVFCILMTTVATMLHALADCPFRSPAILSLFFVSLAALDGFLPRLKEREEEEETK